MQAENFWSALDSIGETTADMRLARMKVSNYVEANREETERLEVKRNKIKRMRRKRKSGRVGGRKKQITPEQTAEILKLREDGLSYPAISRQLDIGITTCWKEVRRCS